MTWQICELPSVVAKSLTLSGAPGPRDPRPFVTALTGPPHEYQVVGGSLTFPHSSSLVYSTRM